MSDEAQRVLQAAYESSHRSTVAALAGVTTADPLLDTYAEALHGLDGSLQSTLTWTQSSIACRAGCSFCCWLQIDVRAHEVFLIARHLRRTRSPEELAALRTRSSVKQGETASQAGSEPPAHTMVKCLLLENGLCSVYDLRPAACRRYHSRSVSACEQLWHGDEPSEEIQIPFVAEMGRHVANGIHNAFVRAGFDGFCYDLTAALAEALSDPECEHRWLAKEKAFSSAAESKVPPGFSQAEAVERLRASLG